MKIAPFTLTQGAGQPRAVELAYLQAEGWHAEDEYTPISIPNLDERKWSCTQSVLPGHPGSWLAGEPPVPGVSIPPQPESHPPVIIFEAVSSLPITTAGTDTTGFAQATAATDLPPGAAATGIEQSEPVALPLKVSPMDPHLRTSGRFDWRDPAGPRCSWPGTGMQIAFTGRDINVLLKDSGEDYYNVVVDGGPPSILATKPGQERYALARDLPAGRHDVQLFKRTESFVGTTQFLGFELDGDASLEETPEPPGHHIEIIGDSISCGYGNEAHDPGEPSSPATENNFLAYGALTARELGADYSCIAWSGRKMWPDNTIPEIYRRTLPQDPTSTWDHSLYPPDAVLVNLGTNDFREGIPEPGPWSLAYREFVQRLRSLYPGAHIFCAIGPMMTDEWPAGQQHLSTIRHYVQDVVHGFEQHGVKNIHFLEFPTQDPADGCGASWHPGLKTHRKMADLLQKALEEKLGWKNPGIM